MPVFRRGLCPFFFALRSFAFATRSSMDFLSFNQNPTAPSRMRKIGSSWSARVVLVRFRNCVCERVVASVFLLLRVFELSWRPRKFPLLDLSPDPVVACSPLHFICCAQVLICWSCLKPLLKRLADQVEFCRDTATRILIRYPGQVYTDSEVKLIEWQRIDCCSLSLSAAGSAVNLHKLTSVYIFLRWHARVSTRPTLSCEQDGRCLHRG